MIKRKRLSTDHGRGAPVIVKWDPKVPATLLTRGEQVSEVKFADGRVRFIPNGQIKPGE